MLLEGVNGELKEAAEGNLVTQMGNGSAKKNASSRPDEQPAFPHRVEGGPC